MEIPQIPNQAGEREMLTAFLDYYRALMIDKASGLTDEQIHSRHEPSTLTLGGLINHLALVEDDWFVKDFEGGELPEPWHSAPWGEDRDWEFNTADQFPSEDVIGRYKTAIDRAREIVAGAKSLDQLSQRTDRRGEQWSLRWILIHMIEETARHCGHADLIRESIDGQVGDFRDS